MFREILQLILSENMTSKKQIAEALSIQMETLDDMLRMLTERGMLTVAECEPLEKAKCASCPMSESNCKTGNLGQVYYVTERGKRYASK
ncbi:MAG: FeoC-like transcriptional regulator [Candidatus Thorarchaeota archaeon]